MEIEFSQHFIKQLKKLGKKYRYIADDVDIFIQDLICDRVEGDKLQGIDRNVYKARIKNTSTNKGKSGGFRVVYEIRSDGSILLLLTIYSKSEQQNITLKELKKLFWYDRTLTPPVAK